MKLEEAFDALLGLEVIVQFLVARVQQKVRTRMP
jgi:hypothetical protein